MLLHGLLLDPVALYFTLFLYAAPRREGKTGIMSKRLERLVRKSREPDFPLQNEPFRRHPGQLVSLL